MVFFIWNVLYRRLLIHTIVHSLCPGLLCHSNVPEPPGKASEGEPEA